MNKNIRISMPQFNNLTASFQNQKIRFILILLSGAFILPLQQIRSEELFLKCIGKFEINRGPLIKPDWETSYLTINLAGLKSSIDDNGIKKDGRTVIRRKRYTITQRDNRNRIKNIYMINVDHGTYMLESPQSNRTLIGTCEKGRG